MNIADELALFRESGYLKLEGLINGEQLRRLQAAYHAEAARVQEEWAALTLSGSAEEKQAQLKYSSCEGFPVCLRAQTSRNLPS